MPITRFYDRINGNMGEYRFTSPFWHRYIRRYTMTKFDFPLTPRPALLNESDHTYDEYNAPISGMTT